MKRLLRQLKHAGPANTGHTTFTTTGPKRPNQEYGQAIIRIIVGGVIFGYLLYTIFADAVLSAQDRYIFVTAIIFYLFAFSIITWVILDRKPHIGRRILGILVDTGATTAVLYIHGILAAPIFIVYLWIIFGNGFRFGIPYLSFATVCSVAGFSFVTSTSAYQEVNSYFTIGILTGLIVLPFYVAALLKRLTNSLELAEAANIAKSHFLATMSHEIRTPLNGLIGITEMLSKTEMSEKQHHYVELVSQSSEWLMRVISDSLDFSKIEAGEFLLVQEPFNLQSTLKELSSFYQGIHTGDNIDFTCTLAPNLPQTVIGDQLRLKQILGNLLSNAFKFIEKGIVNLQVNTISADEKDCRIQFIVSDTGIGIAPENQNHIFEPFQQEEAATAKKYGGTGLGLAITDRIVNLMGGKLDLESTPGKGSRFSFSVDFLIAADHDIKVKEQESFEVLQWQRPPRLLLAEDHEINREVIVSHLENMGCQVTLAQNGAEAVKHFQSNSFDLIFMDCQMPEMDGYEATRRIRTSELQSGHGDRIPLVALTAHVTVEDRRKCLESGMDDYLGKPFRAHDLKMKLCKWLAPLLSKSTNRPPEAAPEPAPPETPAVNISSASKRKKYHDLKNVLYVIQGNAELLQMESELDKESNDYLDRIIEATERANSIILELSQKTSNTK